MSDQIIASVQKNSREQIRIALSEFRGHRLANLRIWFEADDGELRPGNKGIAFKLDKLAAVIEALQLLEAEAGRLGLVEVSP